MTNYFFRDFTRAGRDGNDDYHLVDKKKGIVLVADGIAKEGTGLQAAYQAVHTAYLQMTFINDLLQNGGIKPSEVEATIADAFAIANDTLLAIPSRISGYARWGTTLDAVMLVDEYAYYGHVGDGRIFYASNEGFRQLAGPQLTPSPGATRKEIFEYELYALTLPLDNYVGFEQMRVATGRVRLDPGEHLLLVTDGVLKAARPRELERIFAPNTDPYARLVQLLSYGSVYTWKVAAKENVGLGKAENIPKDELVKAENMLKDDATFVIVQRGANWQE